MWGKTGTVFVAILILFVLGCRYSESARTVAMEYYVSPNGNDNNSGTLDSPWQTLGYALSNLSAGDVLFLREGTYYENDIDVDLNGTASAPITIRSYPGEQATIDGGVPYFKNTAGSEWEPVNNNIRLFRSRRTFSGDFVRAWLIDDDVQLVEYESADNLESTNYGPVNGFAPLYMGPGIQLRDDGHLYIRLQYNPNDLTDASGNPIPPTPSDTNPNNNRIAVFSSTRILVLDAASHLHFRDLHFAHAQSILDIRNGTHDIELSGCHLNYSRTGLVIRDNVHDWEIHDCEFNNGLPDYVYWTDVKHRDEEVSEAYPEFQSLALTGSMPGFHIHHNVFRDSFDAIKVDEGTTNTRITENIFRDLRDDSINLSRGISNVEVAHNMLWHVMGGISNLSSGAAPGHVYIHHNVIDNSAYQRGGRAGNYRADNWPVWTVGTPFPDHDEGNKSSWWKLYNNTIVSRRSPGHEWAAAGPDSVTGNGEKYVFNNIFYMLDERIVFRDDRVSHGSSYDGNVIYRGSIESLPLFFDFGDGGRYDSLAEFWADSGTNWERNGLEVNPGFNASAINDPTFDPDSIWGRYRPANDQMFTLGASYCTLNWPETQNVHYRGAVPPNISLRENMLEGPTIFLPLVASCSN